MEKVGGLLGLAGVGVLGLCGVEVAGAQTGDSRVLLALSKRDHALAIADAETLKVVARVPVGPDPHEVVASEDGTMAWVSIYGGGRYHSLSVIDLVGKKALPEVDTGALSGHMGCSLPGERSGLRRRGRRRWRPMIRDRGRSTGLWGRGRTGRTCCM